MNNKFHALCQFVSALRHSFTLWNDIFRARNKTEGLQHIYLLLQI